ncbi:hypothetical protein SSX86_022118 [Deinandra increscens subsp. villosa]|uniref:adenylate dimethylallyltransferase (ADP/ATP-dependent) n=1 Tax=Deinandra increscens subsp. villosa TaxID=3103831 RepID=A0AAP0GNS9_9ASTR
MMMCKQASLLQIRIPIKLFPDLLPLRPQKEKVVVVMGATGTGKSRLSVDLAAHFPAEVINADKMQVYRGLDIATNKITDDECDGVPHHLIGIADPGADFSAGDFVRTSSLAIKAIVGRGKLPIIAGGSNSFIEALVDDRNYEFRSRYDVCFLWVDVAMPVLERFVSDRVDRMVAAGMVEEVRKAYNPSFDYSKGIRRAIGVPEFDSFFRSEYSSSIDNETRSKLLESAINEVKMNTCTLACRQLKKIHRLRDVKGWKIHRIDATKAFEKHGKFSDHVWSELVSGPGSAIISEFVHKHSSTIFHATSAPERFAGSMIHKHSTSVSPAAGVSKRFAGSVTCKHSGSVFPTAGASEQFVGSVACKHSGSVFPAADESERFAGSVVCKHPSSIFPAADGSERFAGSGAVVAAVGR